jgi:Ca-activated chloride channel family protein
MNRKLIIVTVVVLLTQLQNAGSALVGHGRAYGRTVQSVQDRQTGKSSQKQPDPKQQESQPIEIDQTVRLGTDLVNVLFTAVDSNNHIISNVNQNEITVLEDGKPQQIFTFRREVSLPINIAILIDLSGSQEFTFPEEKMAAGYFLHSIIRSGEDSAALLTFMDDVDLVQGLTPRVDTMNRALDEVEYARRLGPVTSRNQATALYDAVYITVDEVLGREEIRRSADDSITRRAIILLTDGVDNASNRKLAEAIDRAWKSGVMIYSIGIGDRFRFEGVREDVLKKMSEETGGRAYFPRGPEDLTGDFKQIESDLRSQYLVAYAPADTPHDGSFHRIDVQIPNRPGVRVIHRRGYYAPRDDGKK